MTLLVNKPAAIYLYQTYLWRELREHVEGGKSEYRLTVLCRARVEGMGSDHRTFQQKVVVRVLDGPCKGKLYFIAVEEFFGLFWEFRDKDDARGPLPASVGPAETAPAAGEKKAGYISSNVFC